MSDSTHHVTYNSTRDTRYSLHSYFGDPAIQQNIRTDTRVWTDERDGHNNPRWRADIAAGRNAGTTLTGRRITVRNDPFLIVEHWDPPNHIEPGDSVLSSKMSWGRYCPSDIISDQYDSVDSLSESKANNAALASYVNKIRKAQTTVQGGTILGELGQTVRQLKRPFKGLRDLSSDYLRTLKKRSARRDFPRLTRKQKLGMVGETWLEYSFGLKPLFNDVDEATQALAERIKTWGPNHIICKGVGRDIQDTNLGLRSTETHPGFTMTRRRITRVTVKYYGAVDPGSFSVGNARRIGFDPTNWAPTLWEILPWSFLADYVANIGSIISAATVSRTGIAWQMKTVRKEISDACTNWQPFFSGNNGPYISSAGTVSAGTLFINTKTVSRTQYVGSLVPDLEISIPGMGTKWLNIAALAVAGKDVARRYNRRG